MRLSEDMLTYIDTHIEELKQLIRDMCVIPAPSHHEELRAAFCEKWFLANGFEDVRIDGALNVIASYGVTEDNEIVAFTAHTDVVFPDTTPLPLREEEDKFHCPGVGDDTTNLAVLMLTARYFVQNRIPSKYGMLFVANSCEEGLGNLKGIREIVRVYGSRMKEHISFDGSTLNGYVTNAVGSHRYKVTVRTEGGHSYAAFGNRNAIRYLASVIDSIYAIKVPAKENTKTTYNVGTISGGTSVNTIAQEASMLCEYRSDDRECLAFMKNAFEKIFEAYKAMGIELDVELVGDRPCAGDVDPDALADLQKRTTDAILEVTGLKPNPHPSSTDCNIPLAEGIPAVCFGVVNAKGAHTREEYINLPSLPGGMKLAMEFMAYYFL